MPAPTTNTHRAAREAAGRRLWAWLLRPDDTAHENAHANPDATETREGVRNA
jgi:hypothetical protein